MRALERYVSQIPALIAMSALSNARLSAEAAAAPWLLRLSPAYNGDPIQGAPLLGSVNAGERNLPLIGLQTTLANFEDASCPIFPDSLRR